MYSPLIAAILRDQRKARGLSAAELASEAGVPEELVLRAEDDAGTVSTVKLERLANALQLDSDALMRGERVPVTDPSFFFRSFGNSPFRDEDRARLADALHAARALSAVNAVLSDGRPGLQTRVRARRVGNPPWKDGYEAAQEVRVALGAETEPIGDLACLFRDHLDAPIEQFPLRSHWIAAVTVKDASGGASLVALNSNRGELDNLPLFLRVTLAHELAHVLLDEVAPGNPISVRVDTDDERDPIEQRANAFAAEFLMPERGLIDLLGPPGCTHSFEEADVLVERARHHFRTTVGLTVRHLVYRGFIFPSQRLRDQLIQAVSPRPQPQCEMTSLSEAAALPRLRERVRLAHSRLLITEGRARELLGLSPWDELPWDDSDDALHP